MQVDAISFSAHADFPQTSEFLDALQPPHVVLVHGEATEMGRLKKALEQHAAALNIPRAVYTPKVTQPVLIEHRAERSAKVVGRLGEKAAAQGTAVRGLLVQSRGGGRALLHHDDLPRFTKLHPGRVVQRQALELHRPFSEVQRRGSRGGGGGGSPSWGSERAVPACRCVRSALACALFITGLVLPTPTPLCTLAVWVRACRSGWRWR